MDDDPTGRVKLAIFERAQQPHDLPHSQFGPHPLFDTESDQHIDEATCRLALASSGRHVFIALGPNEQIYLMLFQERGGAATGAPISTLDERGVACLTSQQNEFGSCVVGIVADDVHAVRVAGQKAELSNNVFFAADASPYDLIVLITQDGDRTVRLLPPRIDTHESPRHDNS